MTNLEPGALSFLTITIGSLSAILTLLRSYAQLLYRLVRFLEAMLPKKASLKKARNRF